MNAETITALCQINTDFYRSQCASFSETRNHPWPGWKRCLDVLEADCPDEWHADREELSVLDVACGNLRFETFLASAYPHAEITAYAVDNCDNLVPTQAGVLTGLPTGAPAESQAKVHYQSLDVMGALRKGAHGEGVLPLAEEIAAPACDLTVSFGFMHHVPSAQHREKVLAGLVEKTRAGGYVAVSFWQFLNNESMAAKAQAVHEQAKAELALPELEEGDYLLGWKNVPGAYRYCHHFSEEEIEQLAASAADKAQVVSRFHADGRTGDLNSYLVLRRK